MNTETLCTICGGNHNISKCTFEIKDHIPDSVTPTKARLTLPQNFSIVRMAEGTNSIVCKQFIPKGTRFGPLIAPKMFSLPIEVVFPLKIFASKESNDYFCEYYLNTCNENECNWMMFVNAAQTYEEQNLICYQEKDDVYYLTIKDISPSEHLKIWYSPFYAKKMNKSLLTVEIDNKAVEIKENIDLNALVKKQQNVQARQNWICKFCGIQESDVVRFAIHISEHYTHKLRKSCEQCKAVFISRKSLWKHLKIVHGNGVLKNSVIFNKSNIVNLPKSDSNTKDSLFGGPLLNDILMDSTDNTNLLLPQTSLTSQSVLLEDENLNVDNLFNDNEKCLDHFNFEIDENKEQFICDICLKEFSKLKFLIIHLNKHTGKYMCQKCFKIFSRNENLMAHNCNNFPQHKCDKCNKMFSLRKYLIRHGKQCQEVSLACKICKQTFANFDMLKDHICNNERVNCPVCQKSFLKEAYMKKHLKSHKERQSSLNNRYVCDVCGNTYNLSHNLKKHKKIHLEPKFTCEICNLKFRRRDILENHKIVHSSEVNYKCTTCDKGLKSKKNLRQHMKSHDLASFFCIQCNISFKSRTTFKKHIESIHKSKCLECNQIFQSSEDLLKHKITHFDSYYSCPFCKRNVKLKSSLRRHLKSVHKDKKLTEKEISSCKVLRSVSSDVKKSNLPLKETKKENEKHSDNESGVNRLDSNDVEFLEKEIEKFQTKFQDNSNLLGNIEDNKINNCSNISDELCDISLSSELIEKKTFCNFDSEMYQTDLQMPINNNNIVENDNILDFNNLEMDLGNTFDIKSSVDFNNQSVCLSIPEITQDITLGENAYMLENGTIIEPKDQGNVIVYILDQKFNVSNETK